MKKYYAYSPTIQIQEIEVESETNSFVLINGKSRRKLSDNQGYFDTFDQAKEFIVNYYNKELDIAISRIGRSQDQYDKAINLTNEDNV